MSSSAASVVPATRSIVHLGMDVHKVSITIAVLPADAQVPTPLDRLPNDLPKLTQWIARVARDGEVRACYEASGAGYVLHRARSRSSVTPSSRAICVSGTPSRSPRLADPSPSNTSTPEA